MMVNDFDDEHTLDEEEAELNEEENQDEIDALTKVRSRVPRLLELHLIV